MCFRVTGVRFVQRLKYLEGLLGDDVILIPAGPWLSVFRVQTVPEHVDVEEDVLLMRKICLPKLNHQLPEDIR